MKRIVPPQPSVKDETGAFVKVTPPAPMPVVTDISLDDILERQLLILDREVKRLTELSSHDLLTKDQGVAFERCVKILREFKKEERDALDALDDEHLDNLED
jgi:hypothetical protein